MIETLRRGALRLARPLRGAATFVTAGALLAGCGGDGLTYRNGAAFLRDRKPRLEALARDLRADGRIRSMDTGDRYHKALNEESVLYPGDSAGPARPGVPLAEALARARMDDATYQAYRRRLRDVQLLKVTVTPGYVAFVYDGMLDNLNGLLRVESGRTPPPLDSAFFGGQLVVVKPLGDGWYYWSTT